jgi:hypothetical protein
MSTNKTTDATPFLMGPAYTVAALFILLPIIDTIAQALPISLDAPGWRYGVVGIGANYLISMVFGTLMLCLLAASRSHRGTLRTCAITIWIVAVLLIVAAIGFSLDALQVRAGIPKGDARTLAMFKTGMLKVVFKYLVSGAVMAWTALGAWRAGKAIPAPVVEEERPLLIKERRQDER